MKLSLINSVPVTSTYWPSLDVPDVAYQSKPLKMKFGQLCFMEILMYLKLREPKLNLLLCGEATNTSIFEAFKHLHKFLKTSSISVQDPRTFQFRSPRVPKIKLTALNFQPLFGSVVVCCHMDGSILRHRTRSIDAFYDKNSF